MIRKKMYPKQLINTTPEIPNSLINKILKIRINKQKITVNNSKKFLKPSVCIKYSPGCENA